MKYLAILSAALLIGCGGDAEDKTDTDNTVTDGDDDDACANLILGQFPEEADGDVYYRTDVRFTLSTPDDGASISVVDGAGAEVTGSSSVEGSIVMWQGGPLAPSTAYTATLSYECGEAPLSFTTSDTGGPAADPTNKTYNLDLTSGEWVEPAGVGDLLATQLDGVQVLIMPTDVSKTITMLGALGDGNDQQDLCTPSFPFPAASWTDPYFSLTSPLLPLDVAGFSIDVEDLELSGAFSPSADRIQGAVLKGKIDTRPLVDLIAPGGDEYAVCELVEAFGVFCEPCTGGGDFCLSLWVADILAAEVGGGPLVVREQSDVDKDPTCK